MSKSIKKQISQPISWIDFGFLGIKKTSAQITNLYSPSELTGQQVIAVLNFPPKQIADMKSEVLLLGAVSEQNSDVIFVKPERNVSKRIENEANFKRCNLNFMTTKYTYCYFFTLSLQYETNWNSYSGGDCGGLNAAVRSIFYRAKDKYNLDVYGILEGTVGLMERPPRYIKLDYNTTSEI